MASLAAKQMKEFAELGQSFGLKDAELQAFVKEQMTAAQNAARDQRQAERQHKLDELQIAEDAEKQRLQIAEDAEKQRLQMAEDAAHKESQRRAAERQMAEDAEQRRIQLAADAAHRESQRRAAEREEELVWLSRKADIEGKAVEDKRQVENRAALEKLQMEIRMATDKTESERRATNEALRLQLELETLKLRRQEARRDGRDSGGESGDERERTIRSRQSKAPRPKMQNFNETKDDIDAYLQRFERFAELCAWAKTDWALHLSTLLSGKALEVYSRLPMAEAKDFDLLKAALLRRYDMTADGFRRRFYDARRDPDEGATEYLSRTSRYLKRWIELAKVAETYEDLCELLIKEQFLTTCDSAMSIHLRDKGQVTKVELGEAADRYIETRKNVKASKIENRVEDSNKQRTAVKSGYQQRTSYRASDNQRDNKCYVCSKPGHMAKDCRQRFRFESKGKPVTTGACLIDTSHDAVSSTEVKTTSTGMTESEVMLAFAAVMEGRANLNVQGGILGNRRVKVMRDTGCTGVVVRKSFVTTDLFTGKERQYRTIDGTVRKAPLAVIYLESPWFTGRVEALCLETPLCDVIVGNIQGIKDAQEDERVISEETEGESVHSVDEVGELEANAMTTRAQAKKKEEPYQGMKTATQIDVEISVEEIRKAQQEDNGLKRFKELEANKEVVHYSKGTSATFEHVRGILHRMYVDEQGKCKKQLVVPAGMNLRSKVLSLAHDSILTGHLGMGKTSDRILAEFYWPGLTADVARYCRSCEACQRTIPKGRVSKAPLQKMPLIEVPFNRVAMDLVGPITPASASGNRYILTVVDYATRYPEAVALPSIEAERVADSLVKIYTRVGIPREILSDQGTQFVSSVMAEVSRLLSVSHMTSTPYHPQCNGLVERFNGTLKSMLKKLCIEKPTDWDRYIEAILFAYREVPQESLGFSPFELLYGRTVRGPMSILREMWTKEIPESEVKTTYQYVVDLRNTIEETCALARDALAKSQGAAKKHFDAKARMRTLKEGDQVLVMRPTSHNKLLMHWKGPYLVEEKVGPTDYRILIKGKSKVYHINMLKQYFRRQRIEEAAALVLEESDEEDGGTQRTEAEVVMCESHPGETFKDVDINKDLGSTERGQLMELLEEFGEIFSEVPGSTDLAEHGIKLLTDEPVRSRPYPLPYNMQVVVEKEVQDMIKHRVIEPTNSPYSSPLHLVKKKDGTYRPVVDFRQLNRITVFDTEPMPNADEIYAKLATAKVLSKLDFTKGYWQIPMKEEDKVKTAFTCTAGSFQFSKMPFGLVNSGATYNRMMRRLLAGQENVDSFVDDVLAYNTTWQEHLRTLRQVFERIRKARLTVKPSKCSFGYEKVEFIGHEVGQASLRVLPGKVDKILGIEAPKTKKQVRAFLGIAGYYRRFVPNYAAVSAPLSDLTKKGAPNKVEWSESLQGAFESLKQSLSSAPVLQLPDWAKTFVVRTDASDRGVGAVLLQETEGLPLPVAYISKKLLPREVNYSTIEKECLAIVWAIQKFQPYLYGKEFVLQTDHKPLTFMDSAKLTNARVMRWALALQPFRYRLASIPGKDNVGADWLSRADPGGQ